MLGPPFTTRVFHLYYIVLLITLVQLSIVIVETATNRVGRFLTLIDAGVQSSSSIGESRFSAPKHSVDSRPVCQVCPLWSSRKKTERSICLGLVVAAL